MKHKSVLNALKRHGLTPEQYSPNSWGVSGQRFSLGWYVQGENTSGCIYLHDREDPNQAEIDYYSSSHWYSIKSAIEAFFRWNERYGKKAS